MQKKGQTSTEYLIILGVVIVVALIVVAALGGIPGIGTSGAGKTSKLFWASAPVGFESYAISASGTDTLVVKNNQDFSVTLNSVNVNSVNVANNNVINPGSSVTLTGNIGACTAGQNYEYPVSIGYTDQSTGANFTYTGSGNNLVGTCAN
ncbi:class III signal peptide-containing protein [Candidatus Woesearchaeota archaeon]|nr:class III signal peptide-containing protein [Candidatus Woesearchaeota archaeon]